MRKKKARCFIAILLLGSIISAAQTNMPKATMIKPVAVQKAVTPLPATKKPIPLPAPVALPKQVQAPKANLPTSMPEIAPAPIKVKGQGTLAK